MRSALRLPAAALAVAALPLLAIASCASTEGDVVVDPDAGYLVVPPDAASDGATDGDGAPSAIHLPPCGEGHFCLVPTPLTVGFIVAISGRSKGDVWATGSRGLLMHWQGQAWTGLESGITEGLSPLVLTSDEVWGIAGTLVLRRRLDAASTRKFRVNEYVRSLASVAVLPSGEAYLSYSTHFQLRTSPLSLGKIVDFDAGQVEFVDDPFLSGTTQVQELNVRASYLVPDKALWLVGDRASVARYPVSPFGRGVAIPAPSQQNLRAAWGYGEELWAAGTAGTILHYDGANWHIANTETDASLNAIHGVSPTDIWAVGDRGTALHFDGSAWTKIDLGGYRGDLRAVWEASSNDVWVGGEGAMLHWGALK